MYFIIYFYEYNYNIKESTPIIFNKLYDLELFTKI